MKKIVIKISSNLINPQNSIDIIDKIASEITELRKENKENNDIIIVTSGAVMYGVLKLNLEKKPDSIPLLQSCASIGQITLMSRYEKTFEKYNLIPAQILVSTEDFNNRKRYLNLRNTISSLLNLKIIPVFNENDSINIEELKFGDNDHLSSLITLMMNFDLLIILTDVDGFYDKDPKLNSDAKLITCIETIDEKLINCATNNVSKYSTGGMKKKLESARKAANGGIDVFIGNGFKISLKKVIEGNEIGTYIKSSNKNVASRKKWLGFSPTNIGSVEIDEGAMIALTKKNSSLLASGITKVNGNFTKGSLIGIIYNNKKIAQGLTNYNSKDLNLIKGKKSSEFNSLIKNCDYEEVIHKNNLFLLE